jgi:hypothetical protein
VRSILPFALIIFLALPLASCGEHALVGKWSINATEIDFLKSGMLIIKEQNQTHTGKWEAIEGNRISMKFDGFGAILGTNVCDFKMESQIAILSNCAFGGQLRRI